MVQLLAFECIPALTPEFAHRKDDIGGQVPRVCHWITKYKKKQAPKLEQIMHAVGDTQVSIAYSSYLLTLKSASILHSKLLNFRT